MEQETKATGTIIYFRAATVRIGEEPDLVVTDGDGKEYVLKAIDARKAKELLGPNYKKIRQRAD